MRLSSYSRIEYGLLLKLPVASDDLQKQVHPFFRLCNGHIVTCPGSRLRIVLFVACLMLTAGAIEAQR